VDDRTAPRYGELLRMAYGLGQTDGRLAAAFEPEGPIERHGRCRGCTPEEFVRLLWDGRAGVPPCGLLINAPLWYAAAFDEAVSAHRMADERTAEQPARPPAARSDGGTDGPSGRRPDGRPEPSPEPADGGGPVAQEVPRSRPSRVRK
jgi:hypothetical protein